MSYTIYHTQGIVLGFADAGEVDRRLLILTYELGLIRAQVQSARKENSRHRYAVQQLSHGYFDVIYTNEFWRLVSSEVMESGVMFATRPTLWQMWNRYSKLVGKLLPYSEPHHDLYQGVYDIYQFCAIHHLSSVLIRNIERILLIRTLYILGYWPATKEEETLLTKPLSHNSLSELSVYVENLLPTINNALKNADV